MLSADEQLEECKKGCALDKQCKLIYFKALRYKKDGEVCVVTCPIKEPRENDDEDLCAVPSHLILPTKGCPVMCYNLVQQSYLNNKVGDVKAVCKWIWYST